MKRDVSNIDYEVFHEIALSILDAYASLTHFSPVSQSKSCYFRK